MSSISRTNVRYIELDLDPEQLRSLFGVPGDRRAGDSVQPNCDNLSARFQFFVNELRPQRVRIKLPPESYLWSGQGCDLTVCQKIFCHRIWAGTRVHLHDVPVVELGEHINEQQRQNWMNELALERKGNIPGLKELVEWQKNIWKQ